MIFAYYKRLSPAQKRIYRQSDEISVIRLSRPSDLQPLVEELAAALKGGSNRLIKSLCQKLANGITSELNVPPVRVEILAVRPHDDRGELHGQYLPEEGTSARVQLWMRTARYKRIVAFNTFLRTLLHELCHHLDYELFGLADTFHTEGFYKRESSLFNQLVQTSKAKQDIQAH